MKTCSIDGCNKKHMAHGWCGTHYARWMRNGDPLKLTNAPVGMAINAGGYKVYNHKREHVAVVERVLGKKLPAGACVHHIDGNPLNNANNNLLVCTFGFHNYLHGRIRAQEVCGHADWKKCRYCKQYDDPTNDMYVDPKRSSVAFHRACEKARRAKHGSLPNV